MGVRRSCPGEPGLSPVRPTFHLVPAEVWTAADPAAPYAATSLASEGFIHCTDGADALVETANRHYRTDPRPFVVLSIDLERVTAPWSVEDAARIYPHVFGPIERRAITGVHHLDRAADGTFTVLRLAGSVPA